MRHIDEHNIDIPPSVKSWALNSKFLVDKFQFCTHVGASSCSGTLFVILYQHVLLQCHLCRYLVPQCIYMCGACRQNLSQAVPSLEVDRGSGQQEGCSSETIDGFCELSEAGAVLQGVEQVEVHFPEHESRDVPFHVPDGCLLFNKCDPVVTEVRSLAPSGPMHRFLCTVYAWCMFIVYTCVGVCITTARPVFSRSDSEVD